MAMHALQLVQPSPLIVEETAIGDGFHKGVELIDNEVPIPGISPKRKQILDVGGRLDSSKRLRVVVKRAA